MSIAAPPLPARRARLSPLDLREEVVVVRRVEVAVRPRLPPDRGGAGRRRPVGRRRGPVAAAPVAAPAAAAAAAAAAGASAPAGASAAGPSHTLQPLVNKPQARSELLVQVASLVDLRLFARATHDANLDNPRLRCDAPTEVVRAVAQHRGFDLSVYSEV